MARHRSSRKTHVRPDDNVPGAQKAGAAKRPPKSMVIRMGAGDVGPSITQLTSDFRAVMEPDTASRLKERKANKLKDYSTMAGPLGVTHLFLFSRSKSGNVHLRIALSPRGPTLQFRVEKYALSKDIAKTQKRPRSGGKEFLTAPLLVMNNFVSQQQPSQDGEDNVQDPVLKQLESLTTTIFQSMFPPISPQTTPLSSIKRILLLNRETKAGGTYVINLRHYAITTRTTGISKRVRRIDRSTQQSREKKTAPIPNLGKLEDMSEYLLDPASGGYTSASETELDTDAEVEVLETTARKVWSKREKAKMTKSAETNEETNSQTHRPRTTQRESHVEKRAVKLVEIGPRMKLRLVKVEEGLCEGKVMWNEFVTKSTAQQKDLDKKWDAKKKEKEERKKLQKDNIEKKKLLKKNTKANSGEVGEEGSEDEEEFWDSDDMEDYEVVVKDKTANGDVDEDMDDDEESESEDSEKENSDDENEVEDDDEMED